MYFIKHKCTLTLVYTVDLLREAKLKSLHFREREGFANLQAILLCACFPFVLINQFSSSSVYTFPSSHFIVSL